MNQQDIIDFMKANGNVASVKELAKHYDESETTVRQLICTLKKRGRLLPGIYHALDERNNNKKIR